MGIFTKVCLSSSVKRMILWHCQLHLLEMELCVWMLREEMVECPQKLWIYSFFYQLHLAHYSLLWFFYYRSKVDTIHHVQTYSNMTHHELYESEKCFETDIRDEFLVLNRLDTIFQFLETLHSVCLSDWTRIYQSSKRNEKWNAHKNKVGNHQKLESWQLQNPIHYYGRDGSFHNRYKWAKSHKEMYSKYNNPMLFSPRTRSKQEQAMVTKQKIEAKKKLWTQ